MYLMKKPGIILFRLEKDGVYRKDQTFADEQELAKFLAQYERPITNWDGIAIPGLFQNDYVDFQAVSGEQYRKSIQYASSESGFIYKEVEEIWHPRLYMFCWDMYGFPVYDVRNLIPEARKIFYEEQKRKPKRKSPAEYQAERLARRSQKQGRAKHTTGTIRRNTFHLEGLKREAGLYCDRPCFEPSAGGKPRSGLPSGKDCLRQSFPEQSVARWCLGNWTRAWESETPPATLHSALRLRLSASSRLGDNSERRSSLPERKAHEGERKFIFNLVTTPASGLGVITESSADEIFEPYLAEEDYRRFVKPGVLAKKSIWRDEDCCGRTGSGWKDNPGSKYRKQWERKAERDARLQKKDGVDGGVQRTKAKKVRSAEELEEEIAVLRKELVKKKKKRKCQAEKEKQRDSKKKDTLLTVRSVSKKYKNMVGNTTAAL